MFHSVFAGMPIPYPKRDFLTDDDQEEKPSEKQQGNNQGNNQGNHGQQDHNHGAKRMRTDMGPPQRHNVGQGNGHSLGGYSQNQQQNQGFRYN